MSRTVIGAAVIAAALAAAPGVAAADEPTVIGDDDGQNARDVWTVTARPSWHRHEAGDGWRMGVELEYGLTDRWQLEVAGARTGGPAMDEQATTEGAIGAMARLAGGAAWDVAAGAELAFALADGVLAPAIEPAARASLGAGPWSGHVLLSAEAPIDALGEVEVGALIAGFVSIGPVKPLGELAVMRGETTIRSWRAGAALEIGPFELASTVGGDDDGALVVQAFLAWDVGGDGEDAR